MSLKSLLSFILIIAASFSLCASAGAKNWTIEERQRKLMQDINTGQKAKELTAKEAKKLRSDLSDVARKKRRLTKDGPLNEDGQKEIEKDLNDISANILKLKLEKRVSH